VQCGHRRHTVERACHYAYPPCCNMPLLSWRHSGFCGQDGHSVRHSGFHCTGVAYRCAISLFRADLRGRHTMPARAGAWEALPLRCCCKGTGASVSPPPLGGRGVRCAPLPAGRPHGVSPSLPPGFSLYPVLPL